MPKMRWTPTRPGRSRFIGGYAFTPENDWTVVVKREDVEELLTYPHESFELVDKVDKPGTKGRPAKGRG